MAVKKIDENSVGRNKNWREILWEKKNLLPSLEEAVFKLSIDRSARECKLLKKNGENLRSREEENNLDGYHK